MELERFFHLDDEDRRLIAERRRDSNRLGFSIQLVTVRYLGKFLPDPLDVPAEVIEYLAEQLDIADPACVKAYTDRKQTRYDHHDEIVRAYGLIPYTEIETDLAEWVADQAWMTGDGPQSPVRRRGGLVARTGMVGTGVPVTRAPFRRRRRIRRSVRRRAGSRGESRRPHPVAVYGRRESR